MGASRSRRAPRSHEVAGLTRSNRSLGVNLSLWRTTAQPGIFEDITCASGTPTARKSWKARFWTIAVAAVQTTVRGLGVTAYGMASAAVASRAVFAVFLNIFLSRGRKKDGPHRARQGKRKVLLKRTRRSLFFVEPLAKSLGLYVL